MRQCDRYAVRGVRRLRCLAEPEKLRHHVAHLRLERAASAHDRLLDHRRRVLSDRNPGFLRRQQDDAARVAHDHGRTCVPGVEHALHRHQVGAMARQERRNAVVDHAQPGGKRVARPGGEDTALDQAGGASRRRLHYAEAQDRGAGVDTEHPHAAARLRLRPQPAVRRRYRNSRRPWRRLPAPRGSRPV